MLRFENIKIYAVNPGPENPLADIGNIGYIHAGYTMSERAKEHRPEHIGEGMIDSMLPYLQQDGYDRRLQKRSFKAAVLENAKLKAIFLPELGGRLWSLYDKTAKRELLYKNEKIYFGNLSLRNAWFCGGVEWNVGIKGHNPLTCSPMFAATLEKDGETGLRLYEFERKREVVYSLDIWLPEDCDYLLVHPRIENTEEKDKYMYWWSNIAVPESEGMRICVPAENAYVSLYGEKGYYLDYCDMPFYGKTDITVPEKSERSYDFFYKTEEGKDKYIFAADQHGYGLLEFSEDFLKGRKLFVWGQGNGGKNWNEFLTGSKSAYVEIQAGLAETQLQHLVMKKNSVWEWTEGYCALDIKRMREKFGDFREDTEKAIAAKIPSGADAELKRAYARYEGAKAGKPECFGSGWGALKNLEREAEGKEKISAYCEFPEETMGELQEPFGMLLKSGEFPQPDVREAPKAYCVTEHMEKKAAKAAEKKRNWYLLYHYGTMLYASGKKEEAKKAWEESARTEENAWAYRNLAMLYRNEYKKREEAVQYMKKAVALQEDCGALWRDYAETLLKYGMYEEWLAEESRLPAKIASAGRMRLYKAMCLVRTGRAEEAAKIVNYGFEMADIKEGEISVSALWYEIYGAILSRKCREKGKEEIGRKVDKVYPLKKLDFRMD